MVHSTETERIMIMTARKTDEEKLEKQAKDRKHFAKIITDNKEKKSTSTKPKKP